MPSILGQAGARRLAGLWPHKAAAGPTGSALGQGWTPVADGRCEGQRGKVEHTVCTGARVSHPVPQDIHRQTWGQSTWFCFVVIFFYNFKYGI